MRAASRAHQFDGIFWSQLFEHGAEVSVPCVRRSNVFLLRRSRCGRRVLAATVDFAIFQQNDRPFYESEALSGENGQVRRTPLLLSFFVNKRVDKQV